MNAVDAEARRVTVTATRNEVREVDVREPTWVVDVASGRIVRRMVEAADLPRERELVSQ